MLEEDIDDTHFCCKCSSTIIGLDNYVQHRKNNCNAKSSRSIAQVDHPYGTFDFSENTSYPIKNDEVEKGNKCLSYTYDLPYDLGADVFFSSLELQSSTKRVLPSTSTIPSSEKSSAFKTPPRKTTETLLSTQDHDDEWIESGNNSDNLIKAVNSISGHKKFDSTFKLITFQHDSPDASEVEVEVDDDDDYEPAVPTVPAGHTGGKWKPENEPETERLQWDSPDRGEFENDLNPPPGHTKGKWVPGTTFSKIPNKKQSKPAFEHLKSGKVIKKTAAVKKTKISPKSQKCQKQQKQAKNSITIKKTILPKNKTQCTSKHKTQRKKRMKCRVCNIFIDKQSIALHFLSYEHYSNEVLDPPNSFQIVLENIHEIVKDSPFQCQPCHFYANIEEYFLSHWESTEHIATTKGPGVFWCNFCKFECAENDEMKDHLKGNDHKKVIKSFNRTVPIIIRKRALIICLKCKKIFRYNIQLKKHVGQCTNVNETERKFACKKCGKTLKSRVSLQRHQFRLHREHKYFCTICEMEFETHKAKRKHNNSSVHKVNFAIFKKMELPVRQCKVCGTTCSDVLELKKHIKTKHPETKSLCRFCGKGFELPQDLTYHVRYKICQKKPSTSNVKKSSRLLLKALTRSPGDNLYKEQTEDSSSLESQKSQHGSDDSDGKCEENVSHYKCKECKYSTKVKAELIFHELMHSLPNIKPKDKVICPRCYKKFSQKTLRFHLRGHTDEKAYECKTCFAKFSMRQHLVQHTLKLHINCSSKSKELQRTPSFLCGSCGRVFKKKTDQTNPTSEIVEGEKLTCPNCTQQSNKPIYFKCSRCPSSFVRKHNFLQHLKTAHPGKYKISRTSNKDEDKKQTNRIQRRNIRQDVVEKSTPQEESTAHFSKQDEKVNTALSQNSNTPGSSPYKLRKRSKVSFKFGTDEEDEKSEDSEGIIYGKPRHQCDTCGKVFQKKYNLKQHITIHGKRDEQFACTAENCIFVGRNSSDLKTHSSVHLEEKSYECDYDGCDYKGKTLRNLRRHARIHSTDEECKYFCPSCDFKTRLPGHIKRHMRIHTGEKPYKCPYCDYACSNSENLRKHVITTSVHPGRHLYECKLCEKTDKFKTNYYKEYKTHLNNEHDAAPEEEERT